MKRLIRLLLNWSTPNMTYRKRITIIMECVMLISLDIWKKSMVRMYLQHLGLPH
nr:MAG TPA: hypothetical protein [Bacteriophage sp.]